MKRQESVSQKNISVKSRKSEGFYESNRIPPYGFFCDFYQFGEGLDGAGERMRAVWRLSMPPMERRFRAAADGSIALLSCHRVKDRRPASSAAGWCAGFVLPRKIRGWTGEFCCQKSFETGHLASGWGR